MTYNLVYLPRPDRERVLPLVGLLEGPLGASVKKSRPWFLLMECAVNGALPLL